MIKEKIHLTKSTEKLNEQKFDSVSLHASSVGKHSILQKSHLSQELSRGNASYLQKNPLIQRDSKGNGRISEGSLSKWQVLN